MSDTELPAVKAEMQHTEPDTPYKVEPVAAVGGSETKPAVEHSRVPNNKGQPLLLEKDVGIQEYLSKTPSFNAIIKHRYSDFHVFEVDLLGNRVNLKSMSLPKVASAATSVPFGQKDKPDEEKCKLFSASVQMPEFEQVLLEFLSSDEPYVEIPTPADKAARTAIHCGIREYFKSRLGTSVETASNTIRVERFNPKVHGERKSKQTFKDLGGEYLHFTLYKEDRDTMACLDYMARVSKIPTRSFSVAGNKDRRAVTTQRVSVNKVKAERISSLNKIMHGTVAADFAYSTEPLNLGDLSGNHFKIAMRSVEGATTEEIETSLNFLKNTGFINYYGMQRFGTRSVPTSATGIAMLAEKWEEAIDSIMDLRTEDMGDYLIARKHWKENRDAAAALKLFPKRYFLLI
jgi:tRNA pseudouridine13 synthase